MDSRPVPEITLRYAVALLAFLAPSSLLAQTIDDAPPARDKRGEKLELSTGVDVERGDFGTGSEIEKLAVPLAVRGSTGRLHATAQLSWVRVTAPANVIAPTGPLGLPILIDPTRPDTVSTREGIGDLHLGAAYEVARSGVNASLRAGVKLPTASSRLGLGTGEADYSIGADVATTVGSVTPFAGVTYTLAGDPEGLDLRNYVSGHAGASLRLGRATSAHIGYGYGQSTIDTAEDDQRIFGGVNTGAGGGLTLGVYGLGGLRNGAPDVGGGLSIGLRFGQ
jgi:hypothetical protein